MKIYIIYFNEIREDNHESDRREDEMTKEQAEEIIKNHLKHIKNTIKEKIAVYAPLDFKAAHQGFIKRVQDEEFKALRQKPQDCQVEDSLNDLVKDFLVESAYFALEQEGVILRLVMGKLNASHRGDVMVQDRVDFIKEHLEKNNLNKLKKFMEKSSFKTFLITVATRLFLDFWRDRYRKEKGIERYEKDFKEMFTRCQEDPLEILIHLEDEKLLRKAADLLPQILDKLDYKEKLVIKMRYKHNMKMSEIARTLDLSRYKTEQLLAQTEYKIKKEILPLIKNKGGKE